jgi:hypothetical protein
VSRVVMFAGVIDAPDKVPLESAEWLTESHATPSDHYFGLVHTNDLGSGVFDQATRASMILNNWNTLGLPGNATTVDGTTPPYGNSHRLTTSRCLLALGNSVCAMQSQTDKESAAHSQLILDGAQNDPYLAAWTYMLTAN